MKITSTLSIATLAIAGLFATGCSQQQVDGGGSQVAGSSQQVAGSSQEATGSSQQVAGSSQSSQQVQTAPETEAATTAPAPAPAPVVTDANSHTHPAIPNCTDSITHTHPNGSIKHTHNYGCKGRASGNTQASGNRWTHTHPAIPNCTKSIRHTHKYSNRNHTHNYGCKGKGKGSQVNIHALQRKLKAKGYYRGPINGVVTPETRSALQKYMQNR